MQPFKPNRTGINYLGYPELTGCFRKDKRTIQRWIEQGKFPKPCAVYGQDPMWRLEKVQAFVAKEEARHLLNVGPDEIEKVIAQLAAGALALRTGEEVDPATLGVYVNQLLSEEQFQAMEWHEHAQRIKHLRELPVDDAMAVAIAAMPQLKPFLIAGATPAFREAVSHPGGIAVQRQSIFDLFRWHDAEVRRVEDEITPPDAYSSRKRFAEYDLARAMIIFAWLSPVARPEILGMLHPEDEAYLLNEPRLTELALAALDDTKWAAASPILMERLNRHRDGAK